MKLMIEIRMENAAFENDPSGEVSRILRTVVQRVDFRGDNEAKLRDSNGNTCGWARVED